mgnify:CR=1 FL=1
MNLNLAKIVSSIKREELSSYKDVVKNINYLEGELLDLSDVDLKEKVNKLQIEIKKSYKKKLSKKNICDIFAITREASRRFIGLRPFDTQVLAGLILNDGFITDMKTGEGKTLAATLPTVAQSLSQQGTHVVTVNEYLAKRDCEWMGKIFQMLGLSTGLIQSQMSCREKRENYGRDITYVTNSELGFDYLRDNLASDLNELVLRKLNYCIIDEVDSILIDEARTPLIISGELQVRTEKYRFAAEAVKYVKRDVDFKINEKTKNIFLTEKGIKKFEKILGINDLFNISHGWLAYVINALKAKNFYTVNIDYIVQNDDVLIVDEFTGRILPGRRWSEGLHQSVEAKEDVTIKKNSLAIASITYQNFFLLYERFAGMTGTAKSSEVEFSKIYNTKVYQVPTARPIIREDLPDLIFADDVGKWKAIRNQCVEMYKIGRPILVGTTSIENSELLSQLLKNYRISHNVLNAKPENVQKEARIIAKAGCFKTITIATNMAGRGTDIILGGNPKLLVDDKLIDHLSMILKTLDVPDREVNETLKSLNIFRLALFRVGKQYNSKIYLNQYIYNLIKLLSVEVKLSCIHQANLIRNLGGLHVIGTERHDSRRIDDQLRGRAGRQGDPGSSQFFLSLEDKLLRLFGSEKIRTILQSIDPLDETPLSFDFLTKAIDNAQQRVENYNYGIRKDLFQYDKVLDVHRKLVYRERQKVLKNEICRDILLDYFDFLVLSRYSNFFGKNSEIDLPFGLRLEKFLQFLGEVFWVNLSGCRQVVRKFETQKIRSFALDQAWVSYDLKQVEIELYEPGLIYVVERYCILQAIDESWKQHLQAMTNLRDSASFAAFAQTEPISEYRKMSSQRFVATLDELRYKAVLNYMHSELLYRRIKIRKNFKFYK